MTNPKEAMDYPQGTNKVSNCVGIGTRNKWKKHNSEVEKRLKKAEQDYLHTNQKYTETRSQLESLYDEKRRAVNRCYWAAVFIDWCNRLVDRLQKALDKLPTTETITEEIIDHSLQFSTFKSCKTSAQENVMIFRQKAQCQKLDSEAIRDFKEFDHELYYLQRRMPRSDSRKAVRGLLKDVKEKNKYRGKALSNRIPVCNPTKHESLRKSVELEIKVLKKLFRELQKDWEEKLHIKQYATNIYKDFSEKVKRLEEKREHLSGHWDEERKNMIGVKKKHYWRIGTYPEAKLCISRC